MGLRKLFLNTERTTTDGQTTVEATPAAVESPAFSLTKVLSAGSVIITGIATAVVAALDDKDFKLQPSHVVTLAVGLLGFLAVASAADVIARAIATNKITAAEVDSQQANEKAEEKAARETHEAEEAEAAAKAKAEYRDTENLIPFKKVLAGTYVKEGEISPVDLQILGATGGGTAHFLVREGDGLFWLKAEQVTIQGLA